MLKTVCINPEIIGSLAFAGHGDKILISDANYPLASKSGKAKKVYLALEPGLPDAVQVLKSLAGVINIEKAEVMVPADGSRPEIFGAFSEQLPSIELTPVERFAFYDDASSESVILAISTGEQRFYGCILLTVGCA